MKFSKLFSKTFSKISKIFFKIKFLNDEKIFFVRIFFKLQEQVVSLPTLPTRASESVWAKNYRWYHFGDFSDFGYFSRIASPRVRDKEKNCYNYGEFRQNRSVTWSSSPSSAHQRLFLRQPAHLIQKAHIICARMLQHFGAEHTKGPSGHPFSSNR